MRPLKVLKFISIGILGVGAITLFIYITMGLWNWLIPMLFRGPIITFWQTAGLLLLSKIFLSRFGCCRGSGKRHHRHFHHCCCNNEHDEQNSHRGHEHWWKKFHERFHCKENTDNGEKCCK